MSKRHIVENHMSRLISYTRSNEEKGLLDIFYAHDKYHNITYFSLTSFFVGHQHIMHCLLTEKTFKF